MAAPLPDEVWDVEFPACPKVLTLLTVVVDLGGGEVISVDSASVPITR